MYDFTTWLIKITIYILSNISRTKDNQAMKFGRSKEHKKRNIFLQKSCRKWGSKTSFRPPFFKKKALYEVKASGLQLSFSFLNLAYNESKLYKTLDFWSWDMLNFNFLEKGLQIVSLPHFVYDFSRKMFLIITDQFPLSDCPWEIGQ